MVRLRLKKHHFYLASGLIVILGLLSVAYFWPKVSSQIRQARAGNPSHLRLHGENIRQDAYLWADTIGWVRLSGPARKCSNTSTVCNADADCNSGGATGATCDATADAYGVTIDPDTGIFSSNSWAWSSNVGWVAFNRIYVCDDRPSQACANAGECPSGACSQIAPPDSGYTASGCDAACVTNSDCLACFDKANRQIHGWAYVLSLGADGWIKLDAGVNPLQVTDYNPDTRLPAGNEPLWGQFTGFGWSAFDNQAGLGWFSFSCRNTGKCAGSNYMVSAQPLKPYLRGVIPTDNYNSTSLTLLWNAQDPNNTSEFYVWRREGHCDDGQVCDTDPQCAPNGTCTLGAYATQVKDANNAVVRLPKDTRSYNDGTPAPSVPLAVNRTYYYKIEACNIFGCNFSKEYHNTTSPFEDILNLRGDSICVAGNNEPDTSYADLFWQAPYVADPTVHIAKYEVRYCRLDANKKLEDCTDADWLPVDNGGPLTCGNPAIGKCINNNADAICNQDADCGAGGSCNTNALLSCRDRLNAANNRWQSRYNYHVYRVRAIGDDGAQKRICEHGSLDSQNCVADSDCLDKCVNDYCEAGGNACVADNDCNTAANIRCVDNPSKSAWAYTSPFRMCGQGGDYKEQQAQ
ncbi:MAG: hypothetical protein WCO55_04175 [Candidatus Falkowbacteria bacterium]